MLTDRQIQAAAEALQAAETERRQIRSVSLEYPTMDMEDAYAIQNAWVELKLAQGREIRGRKIGLTSRAMQKAMQIDEPDYGTLLDDMFFADGAVIEAGRFTDPRIEVELAFVLKQPLVGEDVGLEDVLAATDYVVPALEIIAARSFRIDPETKRPRGVLDTVADNAANAGVVIGQRTVKPTEVDLRWVGALLYRNGIIEETGIAAGVLDHPALGIAWLAKKFTRHGIRLDPGHVILSGSFTRPVAIAPGDVFNVDYGALGNVGCRFT